MIYMYALERFRYDILPFPSNSWQKIIRPGGVPPIMEDRKTVLFICVHNSARSQMAEGLMNSLMGDRYQAFSAGTIPRGVHECAIRAMSEMGIDICDQRSKHLDEFGDQVFDHVVMVCDDEGETCPFFPGGRSYVHKPFPDPSQAAERRLEAFREVRDSILEWLRDHF